MTGPYLPPWTMTTAIEIAVAATVLGARRVLLDAAVGAFALGVVIVMLAGRWHNLVG